MPQKEHCPVNLSVPIRWNTTPQSEGMARLSMASCAVMGRLRECFKPAQQSPHLRDTCTRCRVQEDGGKNAPIGRCPPTSQEGGQCGACVRCLLFHLHPFYLTRKRPCFAEFVSIGPLVAIWIRDRSMMEILRY